MTQLQLCVLDERVRHHQGVGRDVPYLLLWRQYKKGSRSHCLSGKWPWHSIFVNSASQQGHVGDDQPTFLSLSPPSAAAMGPALSRCPAGESPLCSTASAESSPARRDWARAGRRPATKGSQDRAHQMTFYAIKQDPLPTRTPVARLLLRFDRRSESCSLGSRNAVPELHPSVSRPNDVFVIDPPTSVRWSTSCNSRRPHRKSKCSISGDARG